MDRRRGQDREADGILKRIVDQAAAVHDLMPEMRVAVPLAFPGNDRIGDPMGALPMVGNGAHRVDLARSTSPAPRLGSSAAAVLPWALAFQFRILAGAAGDIALLSAQAIVELHDQRTRAWHLADPQPRQSVERSAAAADAAEWAALVAGQHRANFDLWHIEDEARRPGATDAELAAVKRRIDTTNQLRNDLAEELDRALIAWLAQRGLPNEAAPLNSETPGLIIDRLSILALKIYHTGEEAARANAPQGHAERNRERLRILEEQRADLAGCLDALWSETLAGIRRFKLYRQLKMYNDPALNPAIYRQNPPG